jgi:predicted deacylase
MKNKPFSILDIKISPGERKSIELPAASLYTQTPINIPVHIIHGKEKGPRLFLFAAVHGDEINGVEIIHRLLTHHNLKHLKGTLIAVPVVNVYGFVSLSRYLPDRRDLNRSFPGSKTGSLAARIAHLLMEQIISKCTHGIDLHTGNIHSENLAHIRANLDVPGSKQFAKAFNVPVTLCHKQPDGSVRQAASELNIPILTYEAGEALRFNELAIRIGLKGVFNCMYSLGMLHSLKKPTKKLIKHKIAYSSTWVRSPSSGIMRCFVALGDDIEEGEKLGVIVDPFSKNVTEIFSNMAGIVIGKNTLPLVNEGDALIHIAKVKGKEETAENIDIFERRFIED